MDLDADVDLDAPEIRGSIKGFFKGIGGKIKAPDVHVPEVNVKKPEVELTAPSVDVEAKPSKIKIPKVDVNVPSLPTADIEIKTPKVKPAKVKPPKVEVDVHVDEVDVESPEVKGGIKGFFKGIGGKIKAPEVHIPEPHVQTPEVPRRPITAEIEVPEFTVPSLDANVDFNFSQNLPDPNAVPTKSPELFYGFDLPMTISNTDWHWSPDSFAHASPEKRALQRAVMNNEAENAPAVNNRLFSFGNYSIIENSQLSANLLKNLDLHANNPHVPCAESVRVGQHALPELNLEFELHKAKIRLDSPACLDEIVGAGRSTGRHHGPINPPGDLTHPNIEFAKSVDVQSKSKSTTLFSAKRAPAATSTMNLDSGKQSQQAARSESADSRLKIDYSIPRKCYLHTKPGYDGLGIHIACDKKTRCSPYIYEVEAGSPGTKAGLRKNDYILEINGEDVVALEFNTLIARIQSLIREDNLCLTVGNEKVYKKWMKNRQSVSEKKQRAASSSSKKN